MTRSELNLARQDPDLLVLHPKPEKGRHHCLPLILPYCLLGLVWQEFDRRVLTLFTKLILMPTGFENAVMGDL